MAALLAVYGERAVFVDGRIDERLTQQAVESGNVKGFFNDLFHRKRIDWQRLIYFDTVSKRRTGPRRRGKMNLHFHALFILPARQTNKQMRQTLEQVFGKAGNMRGEIQFKFAPPDWAKGYSFNDVKAEGPIGKILYIQHGMGGTYNDLELNDDGKRSRKAPIERLRCNRQAKGLAKGVPSNFNAKATLVDHVSTKAGHRAFTWWLKVRHEELKEQKRRQARAARPGRTLQPTRIRKRKLRRL